MGCQRRSGDRHHAPRDEPNASSTSKSKSSKGKAESVSRSARHAERVGYVDSDAAELVVEIKGVDVDDPTTGEIRSRSTDDIACWFIDTNYDGGCGSHPGCVPCDIFVVRLLYSSATIPHFSPAFEITSLPSGRQVAHRSRSSGRASRWISVSIASVFSRGSDVPASMSFSRRSPSIVEFTVVNG